MTLSVKELASAAATTAYYDSLMATLGFTKDLPGYAQGAFISPSGSVVTQKDYKVLEVDVTRMPPGIGPYHYSPATVAKAVALEIIGCWTGK